MEKSTIVTRRNFIKKSALIGSTMLLPGSVFSIKPLANNPVNNELKVFIFSKHLQFLNYKDMSLAAKEMGFDGIDLTVRPKGHVLPEKVSEDLPRATEAMKSAGLLTQMLSTNVWDANNPIHKQVLETAVNLGYLYYRTAWIKYNEDIAVLDTVETAKQHLSELAALNKKLGISGSYHNHSGTFYGGAIWDLYRALEDLSPNDIGCQYDIMHATVEGGKNWETNFRLIKPYINTLVVKDFIWEKSNGKWAPKFTPIGEGMVNFKKYFSLLKKHNINVPMSIHVEYDLGGAEHGANPKIAHKEIFRRIKKDLTYVRQIWNETD